MRKCGLDAVCAPTVVEGLVRDLGIKVGGGKTREKLCEYVMVLSIYILYV